MFAKPFNLILIYILSVINLLILFLPILCVFSPLFLLNEQEFTNVITDIVYLCFFAISIFIISYLTLDCVFGFTIWGMTKKCSTAKKLAKKHQFITQIIENFVWLEKKFAVKNVKLLISKTNKVNAYAISSLRKKIVVVTLGLLLHIRKNCNSEQEFQTAVKAIMAHEMSHLVNKDFLPTLLLFANQKATNFILFFINAIFNILIILLCRIPIIGNVLFITINIMYQMVNFSLRFFYNFFIINIYNLLKLHISRKTEFRCDYQAALACGGNNVAFALSFLGSGGYITIFSTHPRTKSRIKYVQNIEKQAGKIHISLINKLSNFSSVAILFIILIFSFNHVDNIKYLQLFKQNNIRLYLDNYEQKFNFHLKKLKQIIQQNIP